MTEPSPVRYHSEGGIAFIEIDNPPVNALSAAVRQGLSDAVARLAGDADARIAVLFCAGRTFIAGADISEFGKPPVPPILPDVVATLEASVKPIVAALHGTVLGGGLEIALGAHCRVAVPGTRMGLPEVTLGLLPGAGGTQRLPRAVGVEAAIDLITSGRQIDARKALDLGLVDALAEETDPRAAGEAEARRLLAEGRAPRRLSGVPAPAVDADAVHAWRAKVAKSARGQIAPLRALDTIVAGLGLPFADGMAQERQAFTDLMQTPERAALIHAFFAERRAAQQDDLAGVDARPIRRLGIVGGGTMGQGIAASALTAGMDVTLVERDEASAAKAAAGIGKMLDGAVKRGKLDADTASRMQSQVFRAVTSYDPLAQVDLVIEAVFESLEVKQEVFRTLDRVCRPGAVLATNTSYLDVDLIAGATTRPQDVIGLHFFSPANVMRLLEIVVAGKTAPDVTATAFALAKKMGKIGVRSGVCDGFIGNRMMLAYRTAADHLVLDGASPYQVDQAVVALGFPMGPYQVGDLAGLDIGYATRQRKAPTRDPRERVPVFADRLVESGRLGRKTGRGYYLYDDASPQGRPDPEMDGMLAGLRTDLGITPRDFSTEEIQARYMAAMVNEGAKILDEGIAARASDIDVVLLHGYGFPRWKGGPMHWADATGLDSIAADIRRFAAEDPYFWQLSPLLARLAAQGGTLAEPKTGKDAA
ncbi:3-hydroxyacyl-CoA dehydrogenase NAD-binding domain-containing protein [Paracoccus sp. WLY502]|uniref:3-hydroxyacyl-CoA dehydrogenase NAD-binding domain-containing protein n=1 Tax=Paracoccus yibinensis TaxID=3068891 RepID=UPI0027967111|nr:3-hydroxyacyl-CoA dehydrogenase NAD-binding domain-containing protein [Paracoccus sp. WLY502]MDQ1902819.1 3-hydroxyacyl-CoA dehydrogenase NAD-binding domain-containing protein [Paracoccus sp. WLY502]